MPYSRYDNRRDTRRPEPSSNVSPWENGFPAQPANQLSLAGNLLGQIFGQGGGSNLASSLAVLQSQGRGILPLASGGFAQSNSRGRDYSSRTGRTSPVSRSRSYRRSRSRSRSRDNRRGGRGSDDRRGPNKRNRSPDLPRPQHEIYIGNYPLRFREEDIRKLFEDHDIKIKNLRLKHDGQKVFSFAETEDKEEIEKAVKAMDSKEIFGRRLRVRSAKDKDKDRKTTSSDSHSTPSTAPRSVTKKPLELMESHVTRHLAFSFVEFLDRQMTQDGAADDYVAELKVAKEAVQKAFKLTEDDESLKITRRLEGIFLMNNRREIKPPQEPEPVETKADDAKATNDDAKTDDGDKDDGGNWKRRKLDNDDDDEEEEEFGNEGQMEDKLDYEEEEGAEAAQVAEEEPAKTSGPEEEEVVEEVAQPENGKLESSVAEEDDDVLELVDDEDPNEIEEEEDTGKKQDKEEEEEVEESSPTKTTGRGGAARGRASGRARRSRGRKP